MAERVRAFDWSNTPVGAPDAWPQSLRTAVCLVLAAKQPMFLAWGSALTLLYNDAYAGVLGSKHPKALGQPFEMAWSDIWPQFGPLVGRVMAGEALSFDDLPIMMRRNGYPEDTSFSFSYTPLHDESGRIAGLFCACVETTAKVRAEQQLRVAAEALARLNVELEQRVEERTRDRDRIWRLSTDLMLVADFEARTHAVNPAWTTLLGWSRHELIRMNFLSLIHPEDIAATRREVGRLAEGIITIRFENRYRQRDGSYRWLSWTAVPDEHFIHAVGRDVQAEKEAAEVLRRTEEQLRQAQKMEAIGQLTGGIAHDFNNLLTGISGSLELLRMRVVQGRIGDLNRYIDAALGGAGRAAALTHRLLAFSRQQTLEARPVLANPLIAGMEELIGRTVGPSINVETRLAGSLWPT
ncbi:MAG TPA: PAS domain-containing protein, partial [Rhodopila sp.]|nr:PAS domain-containing protein [Rhodopila sp.]